jgi:hypothetical protein
MVASALLSAIPKNPMMIMLVKGLGSCLLGGTVLWWVVNHVGPTRGTVLVHVYVPNVEVTVGDRTYQVKDRLDVPIERELPAGQYLLRMRRGDQVLYEEWFTVDRGDNVVLPHGLVKDHIPCHP